MTSDVVDNRRGRSRNGAAFLMIALAKSTQTRERSIQNITDDTELSSDVKVILLGGWGSHKVDYIELKMCGGSKKHA